MQVSKSLPETLFGKTIRYVIPPFQRPYVWNREDQWEPFWEDVQNAIEEYLESGAQRPHFMGAVVLQQQPSLSSLIDTRIVVDGQQRLTTFQLLLDAVQEILEERGDKYPAERLSHMVLNGPAFRGNDPDNAFKVWPTISDQPAFRQTMNNDSTSVGYERSSIVQAHDFFKGKVSQWLDELPEQRETRTEALEVAVKRLLELVVIDLDNTDDPHVIFETLNARGTPLRQSDLVKNAILHQAGVGIESQTEEASRLWSFDNDWWRQEITQGRLRRPRIDAFLNYWLVVRRRDEILASNVFPAFRAYTENSGHTIQAIAQDIGDVGAVYHRLEQDRYDDMESFCYRWRTMQVGVMTPVLLWLLSSGVPAQQRAKGLRALESYLVRRMICSLTPKDYNRLFVALLGELEAHGAERAGDTILEFLAKQDAHVRQWPDDQMLEDAFRSLPIYRSLSRGRLRMVLEGIEAQLRTSKAEGSAVQRNLTIEHLIPQGWRQNRADWDLPEENEDPIRAASNRDRLIHSIGNLTLCTGRLNASMSNGPWLSKHEESGEIETLGKRDELDKHSVLFLNKDLLENAPDVWDESAIADRARRLCQAAIKVWPHADGI